MYNSIVATDMFTLRGEDDFERMDDAQLADLGIERICNAFLLDGRVVHKIEKFDTRTFLSRIAKILVPELFHAARA